MRAASQEPETPDTVTQETVTAPVRQSATQDVPQQDSRQQDPVQREPVKQEPAKHGSPNDGPDFGPKFGAVDVERFSRNLARLVEEGGRALAAYLKPREQGRVTDEVAEELGEIVKTLGQVAEYWLADPQRAVELQQRLGKAYLELWAAASRRLAGEPGAAFVAPAAGDKRFSDPGMDVEPVLRLPQTGLSPHLAMGRQTGRRRGQSRSAYAAEGGVLCPANHQRDRADEFRPDQSRTVARDLRLRRREPGARHAHAGRGYRGRSRRTENPAVRLARNSRSDATSRSRPAKSSSKTR